MSYFSLLAVIFFVLLNFVVFKILSRNFAKFSHFIAVFCLFLFFCVCVYFFGRKLEIEAEILEIFVFKFCAFIVGADFLLFFFCLVLEFLKFCKLGGKILNFIFIFGFLISAIYGYFSAVNVPEFKKTEIKIKNLKNELTLCVLTDIHLDKFSDQKYFENLIAKVLTADFDALLIVGDMFDLSADNLGEILTPLEKIKKPIFYVTGNHEFYHGAEGLMKALQEKGVRVLQNEAEIFKGINIAGLHDLAGSRFGYSPDFQKATAKIDRSLPLIVLAHQPRYVRDSEISADLIISGHTHSGQILPFSLIVKMANGYLKGLYKEPNRQIYVSSGAGFWGSPIRFLAPAEIAILELKKDQK